MEPRISSSMADRIVRGVPQVVYGDTDSVMIKFGTEDLGEAMKVC